MMVKTQYKPYSKYKPSGVEWIGEIPEGWEVRRWRFIAKCNPTKGEAMLSEDLEVQFVPMELVPDEGYLLDLFETRKAREVNKGYTYFINGDILIAKITPCFENGKGAIAENLTNGIGFGTTELHVYRAHQDKMNSRYLFLISKLKAFRSLGEASMKGAAGQKRVTDLFIKDSIIPLPLLPEQRAIVDFLDRETSRINSIVAKQTRMIELLKEKRSVLITQSVTRGLDPKTKMKPSGVEWIREIPEGWGVRKVKFTAPSNKVKLKNSDYKIALENIESFTGRYIESEVPFEGEGIAFDNSSILYGKLRPYLCKVYMPEKEGLCVSEFLVMIPNEALSCKQFLFHYFLSYLFTDVINGATFGSKMPRADWKIVGNFKLFLPPLSEQHAIADFLDRETLKVGTMVGKIEKQIELLNEYKQSLITYAVTGKIDVRGELNAQNP